MFKTASIVVSTIASVQASYPTSQHYGGSAAHAHSDSKSASVAHSAAVGGYDNDQYAKQAYGSDQDSRWGRSYDSVKAQSFTDEQYVRGVDADDDSWAVDYDRWDNEEKEAKEEGASSTEVKGGDKDEPVFNKPKGVTDIVDT